MKSSHTISASPATGKTQHSHRTARQDDHDRIITDACDSMAKVQRHYGLAPRLSRPLVLALAAALGLTCLVIAASPDLLP